MKDCSECSECLLQKDLSCFVDNLCCDCYTMCKLQKRTDWVALRDSKKALIMEQLALVDTIDVLDTESMKITLRCIQDCLNVLTYYVYN